MRAGEDRRLPGPAQRLDRPQRILRYDGSPMGERLPPTCKVQATSDSAISGCPSRQSARLAVAFSSAAPRPCGEHEQMRLAAVGDGRDVRRLLQNDMSVRTADAEGTDACTARTIVAIPSRTFGACGKRALLQAELRIGRTKIHQRREFLVLERHDRLDQAGDARRGVEMPDVGLQRAKTTESTSGVAARNTRVRAAISIGSPSGVPVPCASM